MKEEPDKPARPKAPRSSENATISFSLPLAMKKKIEEEAANSDRKVSQWLVHNLKKIIANIENSTVSSTSRALTHVKNEKEIKNGKTA